MAEALFQLGQKALIINEHDEVLLVGQDIPEKGGLVFDFPGGRIDEGEEHLGDALKREIREELQVEIVIHQLLTLSLSPSVPGRKYRIALAVYHCSIISGEPDTSADVDVYKIKWVHIDKVADVKGSRYSKKIIAEIKAKLTLGQ